MHPSKLLKRHYTGLLGPVLAGAALYLTIGLAQAQLAQAQEEDAQAILREMSDYMAGVKSLSFTSDASTDVMLADGRKIALTATAQGVFDRSKGFKIARQGPEGTTTVAYNGTTLSLGNDGLNVFLLLPMPGGNDAALDGLRNTLGTEVVGGSDLMYANPYDGLMLEVERADYLGQAIVGGLLTDHLSVRAADIDWQLWVRADGDPLPVKYVITSKWVAGAPQFSVQFSDIITGVATTNADFTFVPPDGAREITPNEVSGLGLLGRE